MHRKLSCTLVLFLASSLTSWSQTAENQPQASFLAVRPTDRIVAAVEDGQRVALPGHIHPSAKAENAVGEVPAEQRMERMVLVLRPSEEQESALEELIQAQQDPDSPYYHQWLTPQTYARHFGVSVNDLQQVVSWLQTHGMEIDELPTSHRSVVFSGNAGQVESTLHTTMQRYVVQGENHYANASDPEIPQALAGVVRGVLSLHDFLSAPNHIVTPAYTYGGNSHYLMPQDWATIYDAGPLYNQGMAGSGQSIAVLGRVDINLTDVATFRSIAGLPANNPQIIVNGSDPGSNSDDAIESTLDIEWAGAIARAATVKFVTSKSGASDGVSLSAQYAVTHDVAPIVSLSYGLCEAEEGSGGNAFWNALWQQAAAQGQSVFVSSGDSGAAGCDSSSAATASNGRGVNGLCSSPYSTCVGGTSFNEGSNSSQYWSSTNGSNGGSALSYIPENAWNGSGGGGGLWSSGGGVSIVYTKPSWQSAPGVPADGMRDVPDVAVSAAVHDAYLIQYEGGLYTVGGTSAAAPSLASAMALVVENAGATQGNINPILYGLATRQLSNGAAVFHDITAGNNTVPGVTGFNAGTGYDQVTGLGSIDASLLANHWKDGSATFAVTPGSSSVTVGKGASNTVTLTLTPSGGFNSPVTLSASGAPSGVTVVLSSSTLTTSAPVTATISAASGASAATSTLTFSATSAGVSHTAQVTLNIVTLTFTLTPSGTSASLTAGTPAALTFTTAGASAFQSAISLSVTGLPTGVSASFAPTSIASPGNGSSTLTLNASPGTASAGSATLTVTATGGGVTKTQAVSLTVVVPTLTVTSSAASGTLVAGKTTTFTITTAVQHLTSAVALSVSGLPKGVTAAFSPTSVPSPGNGRSTLTLTAASSATTGTATLTVTATGGGITKTLTLSLTVPAPSFNLTMGAATASVAVGKSTQVSVSDSRLNGFSSSIALSLRRLPKGVTGTFSPSTVASNSTSGSTLTLAAAPNAATGTSRLTVTATGGGVTQTQTVNLTVTH
jgi:subtilase family serine protease